MTAKDYQYQVKPVLEQMFSGNKVVVEWSIKKGATDPLASDPLLYAPRVDVAVGPFNTDPGKQSAIDLAQIPYKLQSMFAGLDQNPNPRCLIAIEVTFSGSSKHIIGDMLNASAMGKYGVVVGKPELVPEIKRIYKYLQRLGELEKPHFIPKNLKIISTDEFLRAIQ